MVLEDVMQRRNPEGEYLLPRKELEEQLRKSTLIPEYCSELASRVGEGAQYISPEQLSYEAEIAIERYRAKGASLEAVAANFDRMICAVAPHQFAREVSYPSAIRPEPKGMLIFNTVGSMQSWRFMEQNRQEVASWPAWKRRYTLSVGNWE